MQRKYDNFMSELPRQKLAFESISSITIDNGKEHDVYDIQVEENQNFFANQVLVHNCLLIDDPIKDRQDAESDARQRQLRDWFRSVAYTRLMPGGKIIISLTRWSFYDLAGWLLEEKKNENWTVLSLPAICEDPATDLLKRAPRESIWPEFFPYGTLMQTRLTIGLALVMVVMPMKFPAAVCFSHTPFSPS
jgi:hypothetical protein